MYRRNAVAPFVRPILTGDEDNKFLNRIIETYEVRFAQNTHHNKLLRTPRDRYHYLYRIVSNAVREIEDA